MIKYAWAVPAVAAAALLAAGCSSSGLSASPGGNGSPAPASSTVNGGGTGSVTPTAAPTTPSAADLQDYTVCIYPAITCSAKQMVVEPSTITLSADGSGIVTGLSWTGWATPTATGTGTLNVNDCTPNCVSGTVHPYPATVTLTNPEVYGNGLLQGYADMSITASDPSYNQAFSNLTP